MICYDGSVVIWSCQGGLRFIIVMICYDGSVVIWSCQGGLVLNKIY